MKSILIISAIVLFASCNKKHCWQCESTTKQFVPAFSGTVGNTFCDKTKDEIREFEQKITDSGYPIDCKIKR